MKKVLRPLSIIMSCVGSSVSFLSLFLLYPLERVKFPKETFVFFSLFISYLAQKAHLYFSSDTFHHNKLWKNSLEESAIRAKEEHNVLEHAVLSWQGKDAVMKL